MTRRIARAAFAVSMLLLPLGCITDREPIPWARWQNTYPAHASQPLARKAREIEDHLVESHLTPVGVLGYALLRTTDGPEPGGIAAYDNLADQTIWTGALATAYALKYRSTGADDDRHRLLQVLRGMKLLHDVTGKPGLFARAIHPADRPVRAELPRHEWRGGAPGSGSWRSMISGSTAASRSLLAIQRCHRGGTSMSIRIASTGHSGTQRVQSMQTPGSITSWRSPSWKHSTGQTGTQSVYLQPRQGSQTTCAIDISPRSRERTAAPERRSVGQIPRDFTLRMTEP